MMKRTICLILAALLISSLFGCHYSESGDILEPVAFFYPRKSTGFVYGSNDGVITSEMREASGHTGDLDYLLSMYLRGPQDSGLRTPFPTGCKLIDVRTSNDALTVVLSAEFTTLENTERTLACAGLAKTCFALAEVQYVHIEAETEERIVSMTLDESSLLLADYSAFEVPSATEKSQ